MLYSLHRLTYIPKYVSKGNRCDGGPGKFSSRTIKAETGRKAEAKASEACGPMPTSFNMTKFHPKNFSPYLIPFLIILCIHLLHFPVFTS